MELNIVISYISPAILFILGYFIKDLTNSIRELKDIVKKLGEDINLININHIRLESSFSRISEKCDENKREIENLRNNI